MSNERWHRTADLVGLPGMPKRADKVRKRGQRCGWVCRTVAWGRQPVLEWLESSLPIETQTALRLARGEEAHPDSAQSPAPDPAALIPDTDAADVMDARAAVVLAFDAWHTANPGPLVPAYRKFSAVWAAGEIDAGSEPRALIPTLHWSSLQRWRLALRRGGHQSLLDARRHSGRRAALEARPDMADLIAAMIFERPNHVTARQVCRGLKKRFPGESLPSIGAVRRHMARFRAEHRIVVTAVTDRDGHKSRNLPAFGQADAEIERLNQLWELDSTPADLMCTDGKRYTIIGAIDVWSRRSKLLLAPVSCSEAIAALLRRCLLDWGVPEIIRTDEGSDYTSKYIRRVIGDLGVHHDMLPPYSPDKKPYIERFLGTASRDLLSQLPGFTGHNVAERETLRGRRSFAARRGKKEPALFEVALSPEELQSRLDQWCEALYGREPHAGLGGRSPFAQAASWTGGIRTVDPRSLDVLLAPPAGDGTRTVQKSGIHVDGGVYIAAELGLLMRQRVQVRQDPGDWGRIYVFDADGDYVCTAQDPVRTGIDRAEVAAKAKALRAAADKAGRKWARDLARSQTPGTLMGEVLDAAAQAAGTVVALPQRGSSQQSAGIDAAQAARSSDVTIRDSQDRQTARLDRLVEFYRKEGKM